MQRVPCVIQQPYDSAVTSSDTLETTFMQTSRDRFDARPCLVSRPSRFTLAPYGSAPSVPTRANQLDVQGRARRDDADLFPADTPRYGTNKDEPARRRRRDSHVAKLSLVSKWTRNARVESDFGGTGWSEINPETSVTPVDR
jgi:hypothetical protein